MTDVRIYDKTQYIAACAFAANLRVELSLLKAIRDSFIFLEGLSDHIHGCNLHASGPLEDVIDDGANLLEKLSEAIQSYQESDRDADIVARPAGEAA